MAGVVFLGSNPVPNFHDGRIRFFLVGWKPGPDELHPDPQPWLPHTDNWLTGPGEWTKSADTLFDQTADCYIFTIILQNL